MNRTDAQKLQALVNKKLSKELENSKPEYENVQWLTDTLLQLVRIEAELVFIQMNLDKR